MVGRGDFGGEGRVLIWYYICITNDIFLLIILCQAYHMLTNKYAC